MRRKCSLIILAILLAACAAEPTPTAVLPPTQTSVPPTRTPEALDARAAWLQENALVVNSISPDDTDFSDLQGFGEMIGDARVVMLGEETHGDGNTFLAKVRLIRYLHQELGFDVIAFESGLHDCTRAWEMIQDGGVVDEAFGNSVFPIWSDSAQVQPLIDYIEENAAGEHPLILAGFDNQFTGNISTTYFADDLVNFLEERLGATPTGAEWEEFLSWAEVFTTYSSWQTPADAESQARFFAEIASLQDQIREAGPADDRDAALWLQVLDSLAATADMTWQTMRVGQDNLWQYPEIGEIRDIQMGENLVWLADTYYPGHKIIVWAASFHIARNIDTVDPLDPNQEWTYEGLQVMGDVVFDALGDQVYTLGFTAYEGTWGNHRWNNVETLHAPNRNSLEGLFHQADLENAIVDFRNPPPGGEWLSDPIVGRPLGYVNMRADWTQVFDGIFYIREMIPSSDRP